MWRYFLRTTMVRVTVLLAGLNLLLPAAFAGSEALAGWLIRLAPWRGAAMAFVVLTLYGAARNNAKKPRPGKEAAP